MILKIFLYICLFVCCHGTLSTEQVENFENESFESPNPDVGLSVPELIRKYGYPVEEHYVTTEDEYILQMHRIPHGINSINGKKPVVFLMHGLLCSSADWVVMGPEKGLAYLLADMGYDVWMGNARGNKYSRNHTRYNPDMQKKEFWSFSWHEIGMYDLPAMIETILFETEEENLYYIGHSQGTTTFFVMTSLRPEYNDRIRLMVCLAPVVYMDHIPNKPLRFITNYYKILEWVHPMIGMYEYLPSTKFMKLIGQDICNNESHFQEICSNVIFLIAGYDSDQLNKTMLPVIISNTPAGIATKQLIHYSQEIISGRFAQFDYEAENLIKYGNFISPKYDLTQVTAPVALFYSDNDILTSEEDIDRLKDEIANPILKYRVNHDRFNHLDFLWGTEVIPLVYSKVFELLREY